MLSNSLPDADLNHPEMKTKSPSCSSGGVHMYEREQIFKRLHFCHTVTVQIDVDNATSQRDTQIQY